MKTIGFIHTAMILVEVVRQELSALSLEVGAFHIVDESLMVELRKAGGLRPQIIRRLCQHVISAEETGADIITVTCSSISPAVDDARKMVDRPVLKIDEPMAEAAVERGEKIGVLATVGTTLEPTSNLVRQKAIEKGRKVKVSTALCQEAFKASLRGDMEMYDRVVIEKAMELAREVDVLVLAQGSMARLEAPLSQRIKIPVLSSPRLFAERLKSMVQAF